MNLNASIDDYLGGKLMDFKSQVQMLFEVMQLNISFCCHSLLLESVSHLNGLSLCRQGTEK